MSCRNICAAHITLASRILKVKIEGEDTQTRHKHGDSKHICHFVFHFASFLWNEDRWQPYLLKCCIRLDQTLATRIHRNDTPRTYKFNCMALALREEQTPRRLFRTNETCSEDVAIFRHNMLMRHINLAHAVSRNECEERKGAAAPPIYSSSSRRHNE